MHQRRHIGLRFGVNVTKPLYFHFRCKIYISWNGCSENGQSAAVVHVWHIFGWRPIGVGGGRNLRQCLSEWAKLTVRKFSARLRYLYRRWLTFFLKFYSLLQFETKATGVRKCVKIFSLVAPCEIYWSDVSNTSTCKPRLADAPILAGLDCLAVRW